MNVFSQIRPVSLREQVADQIRTAIIEGRLRPNDHVVESTLTEQLGVSRTPVREALILLEREALIVSIPHRGSYVRAFDESDVEALFSMRTTLENFAAELIHTHLDERDFDILQDLIEQQRQCIGQNNFNRFRSIDVSFHQHLITRSNHPLLVRAWQEIIAPVAAVLYLRAEDDPHYDEYQAIRDHQAIFDAYRARDLERIKAENRRINSRVAEECKAAIQRLQERQGAPSKPRASASPGMMNGDE